MSARHRITPIERERILQLLATRPLPEVKAATDRSYMTLIRIAEALS